MCGAYNICATHVCVKITGMLLLAFRALPGNGIENPIVAIALDNGSPKAQLSRHLVVERICTTIRVLIS
jgi:hypothetical protein